jgi:2,4-dienoyl-CoA reductase-like NADH-dependent reductase (Old Yellow Enzyme family)
MPTLFEPTTIRHLPLKNRFVRSATWEGMAEADGACTPRLEDLYARLADGQVGLISSSHAYVTQEGQATPWQLGLYKDELIEPLRRLTTAVHDRKGAIVAQLAHAGCFANQKLTGKPPLALSILDAKGEKWYREASTSDLDELPAEFARAATRAQQAGFDGIQLHAAHGYLLAQSLSPAFNQRSDRYGGSPQHRARLLLAVLSAVRQAVGPEYPVLAKVNCADFVDGGLEIDEALKVGRMLQDGGTDAIEVSGGTLVSGALSPIRQNITSEEKEGYFRQAASRFKEALSVPIMLVGGIRSLSLAEKLLAEGVADYFSMARPFIREPELIKRWQAGDRRKSTCLSDNLCNQAARSGEGLYCVVEKKLSENKTSSKVKGTL